MLGMIKNSLFGSVETWPWQILSKGGKGEVSYEERACEGGKFATVEVTDKPVDEALREAMPKVVKYVGGSNDKGIGMGMTVPISFAVFPSADGSLQKKLKVWFRIPNEFQSDPPAPSDDSIKIEDREGITVYSILKVRTSLVAQWLRVRLSTQGTRVRALVRGDPTCRGAAGPVSHGR
ncbi:heme-binding protein 1 isoform X3 [Pseudorca crassidens]|uniref:heme-binding protein 1 isoform X3 n=1 Tax=Pseudorca crassidens TaxID=82174 RepID=UPI00352E04AF